MQPPAKTASRRKSTCSSGGRAGRGSRRSRRAASAAAPAGRARRRSAAAGACSRRASSASGGSSFDRGRPPARSPAAARPAAAQIAATAAAFSSVSAKSGRRGLRPAHEEVDRRDAAPARVERRPAPPDRAPPAAAPGTPARRAAAAARGSSPAPRRRGQAAEQVGRAPARRRAPARSCRAPAAGACPRGSRRALRAAVRPPSARTPSVAATVGTTSAGSVIGARSTNQHPVRERRPTSAATWQRQARLPDAAGSGQRHQPHTVAGEELTKARDFLRAPHQRRRLDRQVGRVALQRRQRREVLLETWGDELPDGLRLREVAEAVPAEVEDCGIRRQGVAGETGGGGRNERLPTVASGQESGQPIEARRQVVAARIGCRLAGMDRHPDGERRGRTPFFGRERPLAIQRGRDGAGRGREGGLGGIPDLLEHDPAVGVGGATEEDEVALDGGTRRLPVALPPSRAALDVREQERDRSPRQLKASAPLLAVDRHRRHRAPPAPRRPTETRRVRSVGNPAREIDTTIRNPIRCKRRMSRLLRPDESRLRLLRIALPCGLGGNAL